MPVVPRRAAPRRNSGTRHASRDPFRPRSPRTLRTRPRRNHPLTLLQPRPLAALYDEIRDDATSDLRSPWDVDMNGVLDVQDLMTLLRIRGNSNP